MFKREIVSFVGLILLAGNGIAVAADHRENRNANNNREGLYRSIPNEIPYNLENPDDTTDALAIPSDSTEWEEEQQMKKLDRLQKEPKTDKTKRNR